MAWLLAQEPGGGEAGTANSLDRGHVGRRHRADLLGLLQSMFLVEGLFFFLFILDTKKRWLCWGPMKERVAPLAPPRGSSVEQRECGERGKGLNRAV